MKKFFTSELYLRLTTYYIYITTAFILIMLLVMGFSEIDFKITLPLFGLSMFLFILLVPMKLPTYIYVARGSFSKKLQMTILAMYGFILFAGFSFAIGTNANSQFGPFFKFLVILIPIGLIVLGATGLIAKEIFLYSPNIVLRGKGAILVSMLYIIIGIVLAIAFSKQ